jgi:regulator of replication initiation timing
MGHVKFPSTEQARPFPSIEPVHCENCFDWIERYYRDVPYLQAQLNQMVAQNSVLERENDELKACVRSNTHMANKRIKRSGNVIIKNSTNFNTIINSDLSDASLSNF